MTLPVDLETERACLGAVFLDPGAVHLVRQILAPDDFAIEEHRLVCRAMFEVADAGVTVDPLAVRRKLGAQLVRAGGPDRVDDLALDAVTTAGVEGHARAVAAAARRRRTLEGLGLALEAAKDPETDLETVEALLERARCSSVNASKQPVIDGAAMMRAQYAAMTSRSQHPGLRGHSTGLSTLDHWSGGFQPGQLWILAARPAVGKSTLAVQFARQVAGSDVPTMVFSLEMTHDQVARRLLAAECGISGTTLRDGQMSGEMHQVVAGAMERISRLPLLVNDQSALKPTQVRASALYHGAKRPLGFIVVDYVQIMAPENPKELRTEQVRQITGSLKSLARELGVSVLALSQVSRDSQRDGKIELHHLRDSGSLEADADAVLILEREKQQGIQLPGAWTPVSLRVAKMRDGRTGTVPLLWEGPTFRFREALRIA